MVDWVGREGRRSMERKREAAEEGSLERAEMAEVQDAAFGETGRRWKRRRASGMVDGERE
ncbi:hypothetical protein IEQ34_014200 [Dendrobium chrysotoxum]|uniref:Uncharacterized protein n=1 Tax=Dendrobium chrysotoxum TaxID=161865 RepID=A0AAV7GKZ7_DENCH|nr:hypothetical protein IEQ34_014200 [Dendrobium chrysotoxum]